MQAQVLHVMRRGQREFGTAIILIEQHAELALSLTSEAVILERGAIVHRARSAAFLQDAETLNRFIGLSVGEGARP